MEEEGMILKDLPVQTRNYTIIDNVTGKPVDQNEYSLTIAPSVIDKLKALKQVNEQKIKEASMRNSYSSDAMVSTFTPTDVSAFAPVYDNEYINYNSIANTNKPTQTVETVVEAPTRQAKNFSNDSILDRVVARSSVSAYQEPSTNNTSAPVENNLADSSYTGEPVYVGGSVYDPNAGVRKESASVSIGGPFNADMPVVEEKSTVFDHVLNQPEDENKWADAVLDEPYEVEMEETAPVQNEDNSKAGRLFAWLCYIPFMWILFMFTKKKFLKSHVIEGIQLTLFLIIGAGLAFPYVAIDQKWLTLNLDHTLVLVMGILGAVFLVTWAFTMLISMILALCGKRFHVSLLWGRKKIKNR